MLIISQSWMNTSNYDEKTPYFPGYSKTIETPLYLGKENQKLNEVDQVKFRHFATSRFIAAILILFMAVINLSVFGAALALFSIFSLFFIANPLLSGDGYRFII